MEYLENINEKLSDVDETNIIYYDLFDYPEFFYGTLNFANDCVDFSKFPKHILDNIKNFDDDTFVTMKKLNDSTCGCRIKFKTESHRIILKIQLKNKDMSHNIPPENSRGFDVYYLNNDSYIPLSLLAPENDKNIFAQCICNEDNSDICIFLPNYDSIEKIYVGIESDSYFYPSPYAGENRKAILFYGNDVSQGRLASKCSCSYPNIVSKMMDQDIINLSCDVATGPFEDIAEYIGRINCQSIVLDCSTFIENKEENKEMFKKFYKTIRQYHEDTRIILLTSPNYDEDEKYDRIDHDIIMAYEDAVNDKENTIIINQKTIIKDILPDTSSKKYDKIMKKIAESICDCHKKY
ncbi:MAG TPA: hypothetical protein HA355_02620 [Methanosphaera sp.]|nr:hypothetical protein [Methanosphaera sp.]HII08463.1 hypothetical protein [Methanosphaera sp.]